MEAASYFETFESTELQAVISHVAVILTSTITLHTHTHTHTYMYIIFTGRISSRYKQLFKRFLHGKKFEKQYSRPVVFNLR
jgi:hypothetical protein